MKKDQIISATSPQSLEISSPYTKIRHDLESLLGAPTTFETTETNNSKREINEYSSYSRPNGSVTEVERPLLSSSLSPPQWDGERGKSLWIGNLDPTVSESDIKQLFQPYGPIDSIRLLPSRECAFVNFSQAKDAITAKEKLQGIPLGNMIIRIGFGRTTTGCSTNTTSINDLPLCQSSRSTPLNTNSKDTTQQKTVWVGHLLPDCTVDLLMEEFSKFGPVEGCRMLETKSCAFITFSNAKDAERARLMMNGQNLGSSVIKTGHSKGNTSGITALNSNGRITPNQAPWLSTEGPSRSTSKFRTLFSIINALSGDGEEQIVTNNFDIDENEFKHFIPSIPSTVRLPPELNSTMLREFRRRIENDLMKVVEVDAFAEDIMEHVLSASVDPVGNILVQKLIEKGSENTMNKILKSLGSWLATVGIHKNGTWVVQKLISHCKMTCQQEFIAEKLRPHLVPLLQDQFGNYVVQCCLAFGPQSQQFIFDGLYYRCLEVGMSRFGSRAMRSCLDYPNVTDKQRRYVASAIVSNASALVQDSNGVIVIQWLLDSKISNCYKQVANALKGQIATLCLNKQASSVIAKLLPSNTNDDEEAYEVRKIIMSELFECEPNDLYSLLTEPVSASILLKAISTARPEERVKLAYTVSPLLQKLEAKRLAHLGKLWEEVDMALELVKLEPMRRPSLSHLFSFSEEGIGSSTATTSIPLRTVGGPVCNRSIVKMNLNSKDNLDGLDNGGYSGDGGKIMPERGVLKMQFGSLNTIIPSLSTKEQSQTVPISLSEGTSIRHADRSSIKFGPALLLKDEERMGRPPTPS